MKLNSLYGKMKAMGILRTARWGLLIIFFAALTARQVKTIQAHTEGPMQLAAAPAGPYKITVWTSPDPAQIGELHVAVSVTLAEDASPVLDAEVTVQLNPLEGGSPISEPATTDNSTNKFLYEAILFPEEGGSYETVISITGSDGARGDASFELEIESDSNSYGLVIAAVVIVLAALLYLGVTRRTSKEVTQSKGSS